MLNPVVQREKVPSVRSYDIDRFNEASSPELAELSWLIHADGYESMGFVTHDALTPDGYIDSTIDKARGHNVDYYVASRRGRRDSFDAATVRKINLLPGQTVVDLPAYQLCKEAFFEGEEEGLLAIEGADQRLKELGALARTHEAHPVSVFEVLRSACHDAQRKGEVWFFSIVSTTYDSLVDSFGTTAIRQVGSPVSLGDDRVKEGITLIPVVSDLDRFIGEIYHASLTELHPQRRHRLIRSFLFFCEELDDDILGEELTLARNQAQYELRKAV